MHKAEEGSTIVGQEKAGRQGPWGGAPRRRKSWGLHRLQSGRGSSRDPGGIDRLNAPLPPGLLLP